MTSLPSVPRLLVSVRDAREAVRAVQGGADIIDFKDPDRGPLGRADTEVIAAAIEAIESAEIDSRVAGSGAQRMALSAAMGEVIEFTGALPQLLPDEIRYLKLGLSGLRTSSDWVRDWLRTRSVIEQQAADDVQWVAVAYADAEAADAPSVEEVVRAAAQTSCAGVLVDTFDKSAGRLLDHLDVASLGRLAESTRRRRMFFAVAGRLQIGDIDPLRDVAPDVVAVRSAACDNENRNASVATDQVAAVRRAIRHAFDLQADVI